MSDVYGGETSTCLGNLPICFPLHALLTSFRTATLINKADWSPPKGVGVPHQVNFSQTSHVYGASTTLRPSNDFSLFFFANVSTA